MSTRPDPTPPDPMWERVADDQRPRRRELAAAEAQLRTTSGPALAPDAIAAIVARAVAPPAAAPAGVPPRRLRRLAAVAAMTALCMTSLAWVGAQVIWPEHRASSFTLTYAKAVHGAIAATHEADRASAVSIIDDHCVKACDALRELSGCSDAAIAAFAAAARTELLAELTAGTTAVLRDDVDVYGELAAARDATLDAPARLAALTTVVRAAAPGLVAMRLANLGPQNDRYRTDMVGRLQRKLQ